MNQPDQQARVAVAMSGGVDSSVAAALLVDHGYDVIGMMLRLWSEPGKDSFNRCCTPDAMASAKQVAAKLKIPFYPIDARNVFYEQVVSHFIDDYGRGITPNPCLRCNRHIRWEFLLNHALAFGANFMATGHYARIKPTADRIQLMKAVDESKDQSYVLHVLNQQQLSHAMFPLGEYKKDDVRQLARDFNLPVAEKRDSQDLCFTGNGTYQAFLTRNAGQILTRGEIKTLDGELLGEHAGLAMYTIGQRRGLGISASEPLYVVDKDLKSNTLIVGPQDMLHKDKLWVKNVNWVSISPPTQSINAQVKIRYKSAEEPATLTTIGHKDATVLFQKPVKDITPGQAAVFYDAEICLGGGIIHKGA